MTRSVMTRDRFQWRLFERQHKAVMVAMLTMMKLPSFGRKHKQLQKVAPHILMASEFWMSQPRSIWGNTPVVYVRFNLRNNDMYIGETVSFNSRFQCHTRKLWKHYTGECKCCAEHHSYTRQGLMHPGEWVMMPLAFTNAMSLKRCEKILHKQVPKQFEQGDLCKGQKMESCT